MSQHAASPPAPGPNALVEEFGPSRVLVSDIRTAFLLADAGRHRLITRLFGTSKDQENLLTLVGLLMMADATSRAVRRLLAIPFPVIWADGVWGAASLREALCGVAGTSSRSSPGIASLLTLAVLAGGSKPLIVNSLRELGVAASRLDVDFRREYGYLIDPGHWRERRFQKRMAAQQ